jgi:hypothetical protein
MTIVRRLGNACWFSTAALEMISGIVLKKAPMKQLRFHSPYLIFAGEAR